MLEGRWCLLKVEINRYILEDILNIKLSLFQKTMIKKALECPKDVTKALDGCKYMSRQRWSYYRKKYQNKPFSFNDLSIKVLHDLIMIGINIQNLEHKEGKEKNE